MRITIYRERPNFDNEMFIVGKDTIFINDEDIEHIYEVVKRKETQWQIEKSE